VTARPTRESAVVIALLLPDLLGTYADAGNAVVLAQRLRWRGIPARVVEVLHDRPVPLGADLYVLGGGEDGAEEQALDRLLRCPGLPRALGEDAVTLAVCAGLQLLGDRLTDREGRTRRGLSLLDLQTRPAAARLLGEAVSEALDPSIGTLSGFHNHRGATELGPAAAPLARVTTGPGNDATGLWEGASDRPLPHDRPTGHRPGVVATYLHGPVLARNPALADHLLARAVGSELPPLDPERVPAQAALRATYLRSRPVARAVSRAAPRVR